MYDKKILKALEVPALPKKRSDAIFRLDIVKSIAKTRIAMDGDLLIVSFYDRESAANGFALPVAVLFQTKSDYVTRILKDGKWIWKKSRVEFLLGACCSDKIVCLTSSDERRIISFLPDKREYIWQKEDCYSRLCYYQDYLLNERKKVIASERQKFIESIIDAAPAIPDDYDEWLQREAMAKKQYIFYKRTRKKVANVYCSACGSSYLIHGELPSHKDEGQCTKCGSTIAFKAMGLSAGKSENMYTALMQKQNENYVLRYFQTNRKFVQKSNEEIIVLQPIYEHREVARLYFNGDGDIVHQFKYKGWGWIRTHNRIVGDNVQWDFFHYYSCLWHYWFEPTYLYTANLKPLFAEIGMSFELIDKLKGKETNVTTPILQNAKYPFVESLAAKGFRVLYDDIMKYGIRLSKSQRSGKLHECLCISASFLKVIQKHKLDIKDIDLAATYNTELTAEDFLWLAVEKPDHETINFLLDFCSITDIRHYLMEKLVLANKYSTNSDKLETQLTLWRDYISMSVGNECDMTERKVIFPYDLKRAHDTAMKLCPESRNPFWDKQIFNKYENLKAKYHYENNEFIITIPKSYADFAVEGNTLAHCVCKNKYYKKHVSGDSLIFFLRKKEEPEEPYITIEYNPYKHKIIQIYGHGHTQPETDASVFVNEWLAAIYKSRKNELKAA